MTTSGNTFMNAIVGAIVTIVLSWLPLSPVLGGAAAGYLQRGDQRDGAKVGGLAGLIATVPLFLSLLFIVPLFVFAPFGVPVMPFNGILFAFTLFVLLFLYMVVLGLIGGIVGIYLAEAEAAA